MQNGVWFVATSLDGPWSVAASVPAEIYSIPPSSPLYYLTSVQVYGATPDVVYSGYTPGYYGTVLDSDGVVVYGTGYYYPPWIGTDWYGFPCTYGFGAGVRWTPWTGWGFGFGLGWDWGLGLAWGGWGWGLHPWWGPSAWWWGRHGRDFDGRFRGFAGTSGNVYARFDRSHLVGRVPTRVEAFGGFRGARVGVAYNSHTGILERGDRVTVRNIYSTRLNRPTFNRGSVQHAQLGGRVGGPSAPQRVGPGAPQRVGPGAPQRAGPGAPQRVGPGAPQRGRNEVFASPGGQVFRGSPARGFEQRVGGSWQHAAAAPGVDREFQARTMGEQRTQGFRAVGGLQGGVGGMGGRQTVAGPRPSTRARQSSPARRR